MWIHTHTCEEKVIDTWEKNHKSFLEHWKQYCTEIMK